MLLSLQSPVHEIGSMCWGLTLHAASATRAMSEHPPVILWLQGEHGGRDVRDYSSWEEAAPRVPMMCAHAIAWKYVRCIPHV